MLSELRLSWKASSSSQVAHNAPPKPVKHFAVFFPPSHVVLSIVVLSPTNVVLVRAHGVAGYLSALVIPHEKASNGVKYVLIYHGHAKKILESSLALQ